MSTWIAVIAGIAVVVALPVSGIYLTVAWTTWQAPADGGRVISGLIALVTALDLGFAAWAGWRAFHASGGLVPALVSLGLSALLIRMAASMVGDSAGS
ncbi:MAG TPA: hypothetical protein VGE07_03160 [Herpetosiphonaceae bacterium]